MKTTKSIISTGFKELEKYGFKVFNFNSNLKMRTKDFVDIVVVGKGKAYFVEVKTGKDTLSKGQQIAKQYFDTLSTYHIATENNYKQIIDAILWMGNNA